MKTFIERVGGRRPRGLATDDSGATLVEFALVAPLFLMMLLGAIELGVLGLVSADFNNAVQVASRQVRTGQADGPTTAAQYISVICSNMVDGAADCQSRIQVVVQPVASFKDAGAQLDKLDSAPPPPPGPNPPPPPPQTFNAGASSQVMLVDAKFRWPLIVPFAEGAFQRVNATDVLITSRLAFRNEPYAS